MRVVQRAGSARLAGIVTRLDVRRAAREEHAIDAREDLGDVERSLEHRDQQRQAVGGLDDRGNVFLTDGMERMRSDHASIGGDANDGSLLHKHAALGSPLNMESGSRRCLLSFTIPGL